MGRYGIRQRFSTLQRINEMPRKFIFHVILTFVGLIGVIHATHVSANDEAIVLASLGNGESITKSDLQKYVSRRIDLGGTFKNTFSVESALDAMLLSRVLVLEGESLSMPRLRKDVFDEKYDDSYSFSVFRKLSVACLPLQNKEEERNYFENNPNVFVVPQSARLSRFMLPAEESVGGVTASNRMASWLNDWKNKKLSLEQMAEQASELYNTETQGDIGWVQLFDEIEIMKPVKNAKNGEMIGPVVEGGFVYLFYVKDKRPEKRLQWAEVEGHVSQMAVSFCARKNAADIKNMLFKKYHAVIHKNNIKKIFAADAVSR